MKFKFTNNLDYQLDAVNAVIGVFDSGKNIAQGDSDFKLQSYSNAVIGNELELDTNRILANLHAIQVTNNISTGYSYDQDDLSYDDFDLNEKQELTSMDFSVEMETGTGKTYVYLRTILELHKTYGLKKFIILVPSVAIREGVIKTLQQTREHFRELYNTGYGYFAYDSDKLSQVRDFIQSNDVYIMIMTVDSFNKDTNIMRQTPDSFHGERPLDLIAQVRPVVIMDEPQNMGSDLAKASINDLNPLFKLRYSATHKEVHNLVYRLTPVDAYNRKLVKKISISGVVEHNVGQLLLKVKNIETKKGENPKARVLIEIKNTDNTYEPKEVILTVGKDLYRESKQNEKYVGLMVTNIDARHKRVELSDGNFYFLDATSENKSEIFRTQIRETIKNHFDKQNQIGDRIKVLSLFFIDKVDNYVPADSLIKQIFREEFQLLQKNYERYKHVDVDTLHAGYFASKKTKGVVEYKDSTTGSSKEDKQAYDLIMKNKEQLLSFAEPVSFIFSHSALKEGWDNPNIFQICTLKETQSVMKKRQEIGRGLRLPVNINGDRVYDPEINVLTLITNSSYSDYASGLQAEFRDSGYSDMPQPENAKEQKIVVKTTKHLHSTEFMELWNRINKKTMFSLDVDSQLLVTRACEKINELDIRGITVTIEKGEIYFDKTGTISSVREGDSVGSVIKQNISITDIVTRISRETGITRSTVFTILTQSTSTDLLFINPEEYIRSVILIINKTLNDLLVNEGLTYTPTGNIWEITLFDEFMALPSRTIPSEQSVFDHVVFDSQGEKVFAEKLEQSSRVKVYTKLPSKFVVNTPLGDYVPDWAIVWTKPEGDTLYLVRETKFGYDDLEKQLTWEEKKKIICGEKHFNTLGVDFKVAQSKDLADLL